MIERTLVLGTGFIGLALAKRLAQQGKKVTLVSRSLPAGELDGISFRQGNLADPSLMADLLSDCGHVVHAASTSTPSTHLTDAAADAQENLIPLLNLLALLSQHEHKPLIYLSSGGAIYGNPQTLPVAETHPLNPLSYHAAGKAAAEKYLGVYAQQGRPVTILRPSNVYGPGQWPRPGFGVIPTLLDHAMKGTPMTIWGDGENIRDYLYIDDMVDGIAAVLDTPQTGIFNVGSGNGTSLNTLCGLVEDITGMPLQRLHQSPRGVDVREIVLDTHRFRNSFGRCPAVGIEQGIRETWDWLRLQQ